MPTGSTQDGLNVVNAAIANKTAFDAVNVMAMDYGPANLDMGAAAISAAQALYSQLDTAFKSAGQPKTNAQLWQMVGVTPMIGVNDVQGETFTLANAQSVLNAAVSNGYGFFGNWSVGRDQACRRVARMRRRPARRRAAAVRVRDDLQAARRQVGRGRHAGSELRRRLGRRHAATGRAQGGRVIRPARRSPTRARRKAQWWTQGDVPGQPAVWKVVGGGTPTWSATTAYSGGTCVMYRARKYCAKWWTQGDNPSAGGVWVKS